ncbi:prepilin-type N-terminal cleavage/methylation domain-containing protein [Marisediminicola sp. UYEF4]|uniref:type IV pilin protein n=1 Tax=Marisediminicola sp. UYEF4 TaxID=1756384 RepID=UPI0033930D22
MLSLTKAFEARNERIRNDEKGFTLIELLVVVIIIGILAAIAIPVFLGQQDKAKDSAAKSDLANAKVAYVSYLVDEPLGTTDITLLDFVKSSNVASVTIASGVGPAFCIDAVSTSTGDKPFSITNTGGVVAGACV